MVEAKRGGDPFVFIGEIELEERGIVAVERDQHTRVALKQRVRERTIAPQEPSELETHV